MLARPDSVLFSLFTQATVLEEMPPFPERESSILAKLKKKKGPGAVSVTELEDGKREGGELNGGGERGPDAAAMTASNAVNRLSVEFNNPVFCCLCSAQRALCFPVHPITISRPPWHSFLCSS